MRLVRRRKIQQPTSFEPMTSRLQGLSSPAELQLLSSQATAFCPTDSIRMAEEETNLRFQKQKMGFPKFDDAHAMPWQHLGATDGALPTARACT